ncbi:hypothetical protein K402DRAFT_419232 [Aulographum hederae CBS 113979]|uniref:Uncharacterized protein n=1 Tax=Aulographum hederae CBS 113979 TaxID=1176131 RepID=A0A6G1H754_9PEZI|nr:hypothetical protein K402DRAFT_419232 [Aulographum hederae CBS 113979]
MAVFAASFCADQHLPLTSNGRDVFRQIGMARRESYALAPPWLLAAIIMQCTSKQQQPTSWSSLMTRRRGRGLSRRSKKPIVAASLICFVSSSVHPRAADPVPVGEFARGRPVSFPCQALPRRGIPRFSRHQQPARLQRPTHSCPSRA